MGLMIYHGLRRSDPRSLSWTHYSDQRILNFNCCKNFSFKRNKLNMIASNSTNRNITMNTIKFLPYISLELRKLSAHTQYMNKKIIYKKLNRKMSNYIVLCNVIFLLIKIYQKIIKLCKSHMLFNNFFFLFL